MMTTAYCRISGIALQHLDDGFNIIVQHQHAIFNLPRKKLLALLVKFKVRTATQDRLLYLALLNATSLVEWQTSYLPSDEEIAVCLPELLRTFPYLPEVLDEHKYPVVRISTDNPAPDMQAVIRAWRAISQHLPVTRQATHADIELALAEKWSKDVNRLKKLKPEMVEWAINFLIEEEEIAEGSVYHKIYRNILGKSLDETSAKDFAHMQNLARLLAQTLPEHGAFQQRSYYVQMHVQNMLGHLTKVMADELGHGTVQKQTTIAGRSAYVIVAVGGKKIQEVEQTAPAVPEPQRADFSSEVAYLVAFAKWKANKA